jgi:hypothetical protein
MSPCGVRETWQDSAGCEGAALAVQPVSVTAVASPVAPSANRALWLMDGRRLGLVSGLEFHSLMPDNCSDGPAFSQQAFGFDKFI